MTILITGAAGFVGGALADALLTDPDPARRIVLAEHSAPAPRDDPRVTVRIGDVADPAFVSSIVTPDVDVIFHLAGIMSGAAERDFDAGMRTNLDGTRVLLEAARALPVPPRVVYASSIGVYGVPLPARIDDDTLPVPTLSYGTQKLVGEILVNDYSRRGFIDGRSLRLPGIVVRPPAPNGALSAFNSDIIREPLAGRSIVSPVSAAATLWLMSIDTCVRNLRHALELPAGALGQQRAVQLPAVVASVGAMLDAVSRVGACDARQFVRFAPDPALEPMFGRWPPLETPRALALGFTVDRDIDAIVREYHNR